MGAPSSASRSQPPLRILRVIYTLRRASGGPAESVLRSSAALRALGHHVEVVTADPPDTPPPAGASFVFHPLGGEGAQTLGRWLRTERDRFDAVIVQGLWHAGHTVRTSLRGSATPYFVFPHGMLDPTFARSYPLKHLKKQLYWWWREGRVLRDARAVCFTCEEERQRARRTFFPYAVNERVVAYGAARPPVEPAQYAALRCAFWEKFPVLRERSLILFLGRIHHKKGLHELIDGFAQFRQTRGGEPLPALVIAGPCERSPRLPAALQKQAAAHGLSQVDLRDGESAARAASSADIVWLPMLGDDLKWGALLASEAFILPSHHENFGIAVAEAMACGRPVLISDKVNIWREIAAADAGLVAPDTAAGVHELLTRWAALTPAARAEMGSAARECYEQNFEINRAAASLAETIRTCLTQSSQR
ncbi:glycosyltransferase [Cephaloticoccus primus]|uniref:glycosyltransferase n=1 Tax=Cephaloticoccus primus TaxID=1548207 RepID=UPI001E380F4A|nr:glycosyltransferase [Cephaloticoccus primus]